MKKLAQRICLALLISGWAPGWARAEETFATSRAVPHFSDPVGVGSLFQRTSEKNDFALVVEDDHHFRQRGKFLGVTRYGFAESRLELGTSTGINLDAVSGITVFGLGQGQLFSPHIGIEPFSSKVSWNTSHDRESFYEWLPMLSLGPQFAVNSCRILPLVRGGAAIGNLGKSGLRPRLARAFGTGAHMNCARFNFGAELTRADESPNPIDLGTVDIAYSPSFTGFKFGIRGEAIVNRSDHSSLFSEISNAVHQEKRILLIVRSTPF